MMGEHAQTVPKLQPDNESATATSNAADTTAIQIVSTSTELATIAPPENQSSASNIPFRPRKIRKISPDNTESKPAGDSKTAGKGAKNKLVPQRVPAVPNMVARALSCEGEIEIALRHLRNADPHLAPLIDLHPPPTFDSFHTPFLALTKSILYQQLAYKAGTSIYTRFVGLCGGEAGVLPETVLALTPHQLRQIGVSGRKASYLHDLARKYQNGILSDTGIITMDDKSLFTMLTMVNGIGSWSVHMFMIFSLHRPDVLPVNDLGVRKGVQLLYGLEELPRPSQMEQLCEKWRPYRSVASWYIWRFVEGKGAPSSAAAVAGGPSLQQQQQQQQEQQQQHQQQQHQQQFLDPINGILNLGACAWGQ